MLELGLNTEVLAAGTPKANGQPLQEVKIEVSLHFYKFALAAKCTVGGVGGPEAGRPIRRPVMVNPRHASPWAGIIFLCLSSQRTRAL